MKPFTPEFESAVFPNEANRAVNPTSDFINDSPNGANAFTSPPRPTAILPKIAANPFSAPGAAFANQPMNDLNAGPRTALPIPASNSDSAPPTAMISGLDRRIATLRMLSPCDNGPSNA